jgi:hypothetical protein
MTATGDSGVESLRNFEAKEQERVESDGHEAMESLRKMVGASAGQRANQH